MSTKNFQQRGCPKKNKKFPSKEEGGGVSELRDSSQVIPLYYSYYYSFLYVKQHLLKFGHLTLNCKILYQMVQNCIHPAGKFRSLISSILRPMLERKIVWKRHVYPQPSNNGNNISLQTNC